MIGYATRTKALEDFDFAVKLFVALGHFTFPAHSMLRQKRPHQT